MLKKEKGITLIALVVTIVVLLILAGVSISLVLGDNGIINKAKDSKVLTRAGQVEDEVGLWKSDKYIANNTNGTSEAENAMIERLRTNKLITEDDEVDTANRVIKIKKKDGTVVKEISYSNVVINISKTPETGKTNNAILQVTSVEGLETISLKTEEDMNNLEKKIEEMEIDNKINAFKVLYVKFINIETGTNFKSFTELFDNSSGNVLNSHYETEEDFNNFLLNSGDELDSIMIELLFMLNYNPITKEIKTYLVINPEGELSDNYIASKNETYTFTVEDILTNEIYSKTIEVTNIDSTLQQYYIDKLEKGIDNGTILKSRETDEPTTFESAYVVYGDDTTNITSLIKEFNGANVIYAEDIDSYLKNIGKMHPDNNLHNKEIKIMLVKNEISYCETVIMSLPQ